MGFIRDLFDKANSVVERFIAPIVDWVVEFLSSDDYFVIGLLFSFGGILILIGLLRWLRKMPKLLFFVAILIALVVVLWLLI